MKDKIKKMYKEKFKPLYRARKYDEAFCLVSNNLEMRKYLSFKETLTILDNFDKKFPERFEQFKLELATIEYKWEHRN